MEKKSRKHRPGWSYGLAPPRLAGYLCFATVSTMCAPAAILLSTQPNTPLPLPPHAFHIFCLVLFLK